jgi:hypothetical protein
VGDLVERAFQRRPCDALAAMFLVNVEAGDPPVRSRWCVLVVLALVLDAREFLGAAALASSLCSAVLVEDDRGVSAACPDPVLHDRAVADPLLAALRGGNRCTNTRRRSRYCARQAPRGHPTWRRRGAGLRTVSPSSFGRECSHLPGWRAWLTGTTVSGPLPGRGAVSVLGSRCGKDAGECDRLADHRLVVRVDVDEVKVLGLGELGHVTGVNPSSGLGGG